jgi:hypothetical protein
MLLSMIQASFPFAEIAETRDEQHVRLRFERQVRHRFSRLCTIYQEMKGVEGRIINTDMAKELCPEYSASPRGRIRYSGCAYGPAKEFAEKLFDLWVSHPQTKYVVFLAGGAGSGKSSAITTGSQNSTLFEREYLIVDGTLSSFDVAVRQIQRSLSENKVVLVSYVYCPLGNALNWAIRRALERGRTVSLHAFAGTHIASQRTVLRVFERYRVDSRVVIRVIDNSDFRNPTVRDIRFLIENEHEKFDLLFPKVQELFRRECRKIETENGGRIPRHLIAGFTREGRRVGDSNSDPYGHIIRESIP